MKFRKSQHKYNKSRMQTELARNLVHNFSSHAISQKQLNALSYGLDHHIPRKANGHLSQQTLHILKINLETHVKKITMSKYLNIKVMSLII